MDFKNKVLIGNFRLQVSSQINLIVVILSPISLREKEGKSRKSKNSNFPSLDPKTMN
jgi:hypothetical protein